MEMHEFIEKAKNSEEDNATRAKLNQKNNEQITLTLAVLSDAFQSENYELVSDCKQIYKLACSQYTEKYQFIFMHECSGSPSVGTARNSPVALPDKYTQSFK